MPKFLTNPIKLSLILLAVLGLFLFLYFFIFPLATQGSVSCCYHECQPGDPPRCDGTWTQKCDKCDADPYYDWCDQVNCAATGKICSDGACAAGAPGCTITCATGPACRYSLANGETTAGECCGLGDCFQCKNGYIWDGSSCALNCAADGCNSNCPAGCTVAQDPDCGCISGNGCCGAGCNHSSDSDCLAGCADGDSDGYDNCAIGQAGDDGMALDCNDGKNYINPGAAENCDNSDNNCDGQVDEDCDDDNDDYCDKNITFYNYPVSVCPMTLTANGAPGNDCDDVNINISPGRTENCSNSLDDDCDGAVDCSDSGCVGDPACAACAENWVCVPWSACSSGSQTRVCADSNNCGTVLSKPAEVQNCITTAITDPNNGYKIAQGGMWLNFQAVSIGGVEPYIYLWKDGNAPFGDDQPFQSKNPSTMALGVHTILIKATDSNFSAATDSITVEILPAGSLIAQINMWQTELVRDSLMPAMFNVNVQGGTAPYTFVWNSDKQGDFSTEQWPSIDISGWALGHHLITATVKDALGAIAVDTININIVDMSANISLMEGQTFLFGDNVFFSAWVNGGVAPYTIQWHSSIDGDITPASGPADNFQKDDLSQGVHIITLTVEDSSATSKTASKQVHIQINPAPTLIASISSPVDHYSTAQGNDISFQAAVSGGVWPYVYKWTSNIDGLISSNKDFTKNNLSVGSHTITFETSDNSGQTVSQTINLTIASPSAVSASIVSPHNGDNFYKGDSIIHFTSSAIGGVSPYAYQWTSSIGGNLSDKSEFYSTDLAQGNHTITLKITDQNGNTQTASINITVNAEPVFANTKNMANYHAGESFLISHKNWQDALSLAPIAVWTGNKYPMLVYHDETANIDIDSAVHFLQLYEPGHLTTVGPLHAKVSPLLTGAQPIGAGLNAVNISNINASDYFSYWTAIKSIVAADYSDYQTGLMATVIASYKNAPLIFVNSANLDTYKTLINGKIVYSIGDLDAGTQSYIASNAGTDIKYSLEEAQIWYAAKTGADKAIYVNAADLNNDYVQSGPEPNDFGTDKTGDIFQLLQRLSLAAPYLAAAKQEVILFPKAQDAAAIISLFPAPIKYTTVMASHDMIEGNATKGRIAGISSADTFAYAARSIFYNELFNKFYPAPLYKKFQIGADLSCNPGMVSDISGNINSTINYFNPNDYPFSVLADKQFDVYESHGNYSGWACNVFQGSSNLYIDDIPYLKLSWGSAGSCLTGQFHGAVSFAYNWLRKGGMAYWGANNTIVPAYIAYGTSRPFEEMRADPAISLGRLAEKVGGPYEMYGDPTLSLIYRGGANQLPIADLTASPTATGGSYNITINSGDTAYLQCTGADFDGSIIKYELDIDCDGSYEQVVTAGQQVTHIYPAAGVYKPKCRATDNDGGQAVTIAVIKVN